MSREKEILLDRLLGESRETARLLREILMVQFQTLEVQRQILHELRKPHVSGYRIRQTGGNDMSPSHGAGSFHPQSAQPEPNSNIEPEEISVPETQSPVTGIVQGATGTFVADAIDQNGNVITDTAILSALKLTWDTTDATNEPVVFSGAGGDLGASISVPATALVDPVGATLNVTDGTNTGSVTVPVLAAPPPVTVVKGFVIRQLS